MSIPLRARKCPDCGGGVAPIRIGPEILSYENLAAKRSRWMRFLKGRPGGRITTWRCAGCQRVFLYAVPER
jgi:uncharacterized OB-fold protein